MRASPGRLRIFDGKDQYVIDYQISWNFATSIFQINLFTKWYSKNYEKLGKQLLVDVRKNPFQLGLRTNTAGVVVQVLELVRGHEGHEEGLLPVLGDREHLVEVLAREPLRRPRDGSYDFSNSELERICSNSTVFSNLSN